MLRYLIVNLVSSIPSHVVQKGREHSQVILSMNFGIGAKRSEHCSQLMEYQRRCLP